MEFGKVILVLVIISFVGIGLRKFKGRDSINGNELGDIFDVGKSEIENPCSTRWVFVDELTQEEREVHEHISLKIDRFWETFAQEQQEIKDVFAGKSSYDIVDFMNQYLNGISDDISWEFGPAVKTKGDRLVITCETEKKLRPLVDEILKRAPKLDGWEFYGYRFAEGIDFVNANIANRTGGRIDDLRFQMEISKLNQVDVNIIRKRSKSKKHYNQTMSDAFYAVEMLVGEENLDKWIGEVNVVDMPVDSLEVYVMEDFFDQFSVKLDEIKKKIPVEPIYKMEEDDINYTVFSYKFQDSVTGEIIAGTASTMNMSLWEAIQNGVGAFYSERFSSCGEKFCYIKLERYKSLENSRFETRSDVEELLDSVLRNNKVGCTIGGRSEGDNLYIDLALVDLEKGIKLIKESLRSGDIGGECLILFYDSEWELEWDRMHIHSR